jgi:hypothetical protein
MIDFALAGALLNKRKTQKKTLAQPPAHNVLPLRLRIGSVKRLLHGLIVKLMLGFRRK